MRPLYLLCCAAMITAPILSACDGAAPSGNSATENAQAADGPEESTDTPKRATGAGFSSPSGKAAVEAWTDAPPKGAPTLDGCDGVDDTRMCEVREEHFVTQWWRGAHHGNLVDADAVASCLAGDGQPCGVVLNPIQACAWNMASLTSPDVSDIQTGNVHQHCGQLDDAQLAAAKASAYHLIAELPALRSVDR